MQSRCGAFLHIERSQKHFDLALGEDDQFRFRSVHRRAISIFGCALGYVDRSRQRLLIGAQSEEVDRTKVFRSRNCLNLVSDLPDFKKLIARLPNFLISLSRILCCEFDGNCFMIFHLRSMSTRLKSRANE